MGAVVLFASKGLLLLDFLLGTFLVVVLTTRMIVDVVGLDFFVDFEQCQHYRLLFL